MEYYEDLADKSGKIAGEDWRERSPLVQCTENRVGIYEKFDAKFVQATIDSLASKQR